MKSVRPKRANVTDSLPRINSRPIRVSTNVPMTKGCEELGTETEAERQLKILLERQLEKNITLQRQKERQRQFTSSGPYKSFTATSGAHTLPNFLAVKENEQTREKLKQSGLTEEEIDIFLHEPGTPEAEPVKSKRPKIEPEAARMRMDHICSKLQLHTEEISNRQSFSGSKHLTRHEMDIEKTLYAGCKTKDDLKDVLIVKQKPEELHPLDPFRAVGELSKKLARLRHKKRLSQKESEHTQPSETSSTTTDEYREERPDPTKLHAIVPLDLAEIQQNRLTVKEIREIPRFKDYDPGIPNRVLFLKNLHRSVDVRTLIALFSRFDPDDGDPLSYRLLNGRMKGQAFVTFPADTETAKAALELANGYLIHGKPLIIVYGRLQLQA